MKVTFVLNGKTSKIVLVPETPRDERCLEMTREKCVSVNLTSVGVDPKAMGLEFVHE